MQNNLRTNAEAMIAKGTAPSARGWPAGTQALTLLHRLASAPESASDALKLLHELQVHQVELDLQQEQAELDRRQLTLDLANFAALFDLAPFAYLTLEPDGRVIAANRSAVQWLAPAVGEPEDRAGRHLEELLAPACGAAVREVLAALRRGEGRQVCTVQASAGGAWAQAFADASPGGAQVLMAVVPAGPATAG